MHGQKQAGKIAYDELVKYLKPFGHSPTKYTPEYWRHETKHIYFVLYVDNFSINTWQQKCSKSLTTHATI